MVSYQWGRNPIHIKTDYSKSNTKVISIKATVDPASSLLPTYDGISIGLTIRTPENVVELENHHTSNSGEMKLTNMPAADMSGEVLWRLFKLSRKVVVECKGRKVWEMEYIKLFDTKRATHTTLLQRSMKAWSKTVVEIRFTEQDTGTLGYRKAGKGWWCGGFFLASYAGGRGFDSHIHQSQRSALKALPMQTSSADSAE